MNLEVWIMTNGDLTYLYAAYTIIWAGFFGYFVYLHYKLKNIDRDLAVLKSEVKRDDG